MTRHSLEVFVDAGADEVAGRLGHHRSGWLRPFLLLAVHAEGDGPGGDVWFDVGAMTDDGAATRSSALRWRPHAGPAVFSAFTGRLVVREFAEQVSLGVEGTARGGSEAVNEGVLARLIDLLAGAFGESHAAVR